MTLRWFGLWSFVFLSAGTAQNSHSVWNDYLGASDSAQYSALAQINRFNVKQLRVAWTYPTPDAYRYAFNPIVIQGVAYVLAQNNAIVALNGATGQFIWKHETDPNARFITSRGINYWRSKNGAEQRLLFAVNNLLQAIDARTGKSIASFGKHGVVDLREGLGRAPETIAQIQSGSPGRIYDDILILGSATGEDYGSPPGDIRAYNVRTGALVWTFHTIPHPGEFGYETWPQQAWKTAGGANAWGEMTLDERRGVVYVPTGAPTYDFYGGDRKGANLFADCLLALDAHTGRRLWHFQMIHHDLWDYDAAASPKILRIQNDGKTVEVVAQASKQGFLYVFDRVTGKPIWPIDERPTPRSDVPGEEAWPTQPFPSQPPPFAMQKLGVADLSPFLTDAKEREKFRALIANARNEGLFTPPSFRGTIQMPGNAGGANWGAMASDPESGMVYVVSKNLPTLLKLQDSPPGLHDGSKGVGGLDSGLGRFWSGYGYLSTKAGFSPIRPPWSTLTAYDLNSGTIRWQIPLGETPELGPLETRATGSHRPRSGPVVTAGGLLFSGTPDRKLRAYDKSTGKILWSMELPAVPEGIPAIYEVNGKEYILLCAAAPDTNAVSRNNAAPDNRHRAYIAFALPDRLVDGDGKTSN